MPDHTPRADHTAAPAPELLTIVEAAELLRAPVVPRHRRHIGTVRRSVRLGRRVPYRRDELRAWVDAHRRRLPRRGGSRDA